MPLDVKLIKSKHGETYKAEVTGNVGRIRVRGYTTPVYIGIDDLDRAGFVSARLTVNREEGGKLPYATRRKVEDAVLAKLKSIDPKHQKRHLPCNVELSPKRCRQLQHVYESAREAGKTKEVAARQAYNTIKRTMKDEGERLPQGWGRPVPKGVKGMLREPKHARRGPSKYDWELNASTGDYIARIEDNLRLVRMEGGGLYNAEYWGDYSPKYPIESGWYKTPQKALESIRRKIRKDKSGSGSHQRRAPTSAAKAEPKHQTRGAQIFYKATSHRKDWQPTISMLEERGSHQRRTTTSASGERHEAGYPLSGEASDEGMVTYRPRTSKNRKAPRKRYKVPEDVAEAMSESADEETTARRQVVGIGRPKKKTASKPKRPTKAKPKKKTTKTKSRKKKPPPRVGTRKRKVAERRQPSKDTAANLRRHMRRDAE